MVVNITFRYVKAFLYSLLKIKALSFQVRVISSKTRAENLLIKHQQKFANSINTLISLTFLGSYQFIITLTFLGSIYMLSIKIISLRYRTSILQNLYLSISNYRLALQGASRISLIYFQYLVRLLLYIRISLIKAVQKMSRQGCRVLFIKCQNKLRAFIRPNSITRYLNNPYQVRNTVSYLSPFAIQRRLNVQIILSCINIGLT